jgi:integrase
VRQRFDRKEDAERWRVDRLREKQAGGVALVSRMTLDEYASEWWERWLQGKDGTGRPENSVRNYKGALRRYVLPRLGHVRLQVLNSATAAQFRNGLQAEGKRAATVRYALAVLSAICADAVEAGQMLSNPVAGVRVPGAPHRRDVRALTVDDVEKLRNHMKTDVGALLVSLIAYAGLRPEEGLALTWGDVGDQTISVTDPPRCHAATLGPGEGGAGLKRLK